jgi:hypothetical protein
MRERLKVADHPSPSRGDPDQVRDDELFGAHMADVESAGQAPLRDDEAGTKGFIFGEEPHLTATVRWQSGGTGDARVALESWAAEQGFDLRFDDSFE